MFFLAPFIISLAISNLSEYLVIKYCESYGYVNLQKRRNLCLKHIVNTIICFVPIINILYSIFCINNLYDIYRTTKYSNCIFNKTGSMKKASRERKMIDKVIQHTHNKKLLKEQMVLDGVKSKNINKELKIIDNDNHFVIKSRRNKKYKKLKAMSDAEFWIESILCDINLTEKEKLKLYRTYIKDFYNENKVIKPKGINKTLKISKKKI